MNTKTQRKSRILEAVHETATDLHSVGFIGKPRMREYDALCLAPIPRYSRNKIRSLRQRHHISQAVLAIVLNTSVSTVRPSATTRAPAPASSTAIARPMPPPAPVTSAVLPASSRAPATIR